MRAFAVIAVAASAVGMVPAEAKGPPRAAIRQLYQCVNRADMADLATKDCYVALAISEDARLKRNWARVMKAIHGRDPSVRTALRKEQRDWRVYANSACLHYLGEGGTKGRLDSQTCYVDLIATRADALAEIADYYQIS